MRRGLAVGLDLPFRGPYGIVGESVAPRTLAFFERYGHRFTSAFVSWQPRDRGTPDPRHVIPAWDALFERIPHAERCLHQTALNLAGADYDRDRVIELTNALIERYGFRWVNEDLGYWSVQGWPLPYPQPPPHTEPGIAHCARVCHDVDAALAAPLVVEFPGYETVPDGDLDAYDVFREVVGRAGVACNLDTGHLLTWRWLKGHRGADLLGDLDRLPLEHCVELHCAGVIVTGDRLIDAHHGVLADIQLELVEALMERCPNLQLVTYEDPRFDPAGALPPDAERSLDALERCVEVWLASTPEPPGLPARVEPPSAVADSSGEADLVARFVGEDALGARLRERILDRETRGVGSPRTLYADALDGLDAAGRDALVRGFLASPEGASWSDFTWAYPGRALEDAFGAFVAPGSDAHLAAGARLLALHPDPPFAVPEGFRRAPRGWLATGGTREEPVLYAAIDGRVVTGPITPLLVRLLNGEHPDEAEPARQSLQQMGLL